MKSAKILMTGVTSFTGSYIARALGDAGFEVTGVLTRQKNAYSSGLAAKRLELAQVSHVWEDAPLGSENFLKGLAAGSFNVFVSHGAAIQGYRSPDFDFTKSVTDSLKSIREVFASLKKQGASGVLHTGTVFEAVDGLPALSPYGLSKQMVWDAYSYFAHTAGLSLTKVWIPNPIGPLENEDRLIPVFAKLWKDKKTANLTVPRLTYDHVPAFWLAQFYVRAAQEMLDGSSTADQKHVRPSGFVLSNKDLVESFRAPFKKLTGLSCDYSENEDPNFKMGVIRKNLEPCPELKDPKNVADFWNDYASYWN